MSRKNVGHSMTCPNCETLRGQLARMREASEKIKADYDYFIKKYEEAKKAKDKRLRDLLYYQFAAHLQQDLPILFKALSQTQDVAALQEAKLLRAEADGVEWGAKRKCYECETMGKPVLRKWVPFDTEPKIYHPNKQYKSGLLTCRARDFYGKAAALRKQADGLEGK